MNSRVWPLIRKRVGQRSHTAFRRRRQVERVVAVLVGPRRIKRTREQRRVGRTTTHVLRYFAWRWNRRGCAEVFERPHLFCVVDLAQVANAESCGS